MPFDNEQAKALRAASEGAASAQSAAQRAVLEGIRSKVPAAFMQLLNTSFREASFAATAAAAAYHLYLVENSDRAFATAKTIADGIGYAGL